MGFFSIGARATVVQLAVAGDEAVYTGQAGAQTINVAIERTLDVLGIGDVLGEARWVATMNRADVSAPQRGDTIEQLGVVYALQEELELSDQWVTYWSIAKQ